MPLKPEDRKANFSREAIRRARVCESLSPFTERFKCSERKKYEPPRIEDRSNLGISNPPLQPGQPEFNPKKSRLCRSFRVKGRRHAVSVLKPSEERIKLEEKTPGEW